MSQQLGSVMIALKAVDECSSVMDKVRASTSLLGSTFQSMGGTMGSVGNVMQGLAAGGVAGALTAAIGETTKALNWAIGEASQAEQAIKNLSAAVERSGTSWDSVSKQTQDYMSQLQKTTTYSDEAIAGMIERLLTFGMTYEDAMKAAGTAVDLAAAKHMDLQGAADLVGKAFMGNTAILQRYGIDITTSKEATAAMKEAVDSVAGALKSAGADALQPFTDVLGQAAVSLTDSEGKMRSAKDVAQDLIGAFQSGAIDGEKFAQIMDALGISIDASKLAAADFPAVMSALNEQFGGTAQEQAKTYAGIQERLKNATSDLGEKIGGMVLPALASMTEAMIPVVDALGKGVDAVGAWLTEVGKMPEVQGIVAAVNDAFAGFWSYMQDLWQFIQDTFGPVLQELWQAFKELWDALAPIGEAFSEILGIFGEGTEGIDLLKGAVMLIAAEIRGFAEIIKAVAPYIRQFAEAFKAAADFIVPILRDIGNAITGFLDALKNAFQGFYTWLVGGSLWQDIWDKVTSIARSAGTLLGNIITGMFDILSGIFRGGMDLIGTIVKTGFELTFATVQMIVSRSVDVLKGLIAMLQSIISDASRDWSDLVTLISRSIEPMKSAISGFWEWTKAYWSASVNEIVAVTQAGFAQIQNIMAQLQQTVSTGVTAIQGMFASLVATAQSAAAQVGAALAQAQQTQLAISQTAQQAATATQPATTYIPAGPGASPYSAEYLASIASLQHGGIVPETGPYLLHRGEEVTPTAGPIRIDLTNTTPIMIDGVMVARVMERRLITTRKLSAWRPA